MKKNVKESFIEKLKDFTLVVATLILMGIAILSIHHQVGVISITSESMAPALRTGDTALTIQVSRTAVREGDVLVLPHPDAPSIYFAHRVLAIARSRGKVIIETKGDANPIKDAWSLELRSEEVPRVYAAMATSRLPLDISDRIRAGQVLLAAAVIVFLFSFRKGRRERVL